MIKNFAKVENGVVVNVAVAEDVWPFEDDPHIECPEGFGVGDSYLGGVFSKPVLPPQLPVVPKVISMRQAQKALLIAGKLADVEAFIASLPGLDGDLVRIDWTKGSEIRRDWPFVETVRLAFGWTTEYMDNFFIEAQKL